MYLVWITNLSMNIIQTSQIKSNKMMVEKLLEKSIEKNMKKNQYHVSFERFLTLRIVVSFTKTCPI